MPAPEVSGPIAEDMGTLLLMVVLNSLVANSRAGWCSC